MSAFNSTQLIPVARAARATTTPEANAVPECLTFRIAAEEYGIDTVRVQEIRSDEPTTRIGGAPHFVTGVTDLRGVIVPVVDLRLRLQAHEARHDASTVVVVLNMPGRVVGVVVDSVYDVIEPSADEVKAALQSTDSLGAKHTVGIASVKVMGDADHRMLIPLDIAALLSAAAIGRIEAA